MNKIKEIHSDVLLSLNKHNNTWLPLALKLNELVAAVGGKSKKDYWQKYFTVDSFYQYCKIELKDDSSTMYKYPLCAEQIEKHRPDLIKLYESDNSIKIAGFTVFYELIAKKKSLTEDVLKEILDNIVDDGYSRSQVKGKVYDHLKVKKIKKTKGDKKHLLDFDIYEGRGLLSTVLIAEVKDVVKLSYKDYEDDIRVLRVNELLAELQSLLTQLPLNIEAELLKEVA
tara:strand:- start:435 stop:1115 length:681 start_codon:yes stop_codon:yes gene_type:complete